ncbi:ATP-binding cassette domain-containing protein [Clostridium rectalis]|uniref:ATP-binding cassette domain-containing protein n=1 Tax=Clostridium rectalis TaxID=2040295 RepID=UPI000F642A90|nr:ABC transporter ATP-binding protein [Clostridium rectalis]
MSKAIEIKKLSKTFQSNWIKALDEFSVDIEENKIYGLVGRNGAGKTTLLKTIACHYIKSSGEIKVFGENPFENEKILPKICLVSSGENFLPTMSAGDLFDITKTFQENWDEDFKNRLVTEFNIRTKCSYSDLSKGMKAMVNVIIGLASRAPITIYDETYLGLDPVAREEFYKILLEDYEKNPRCIIFSTHYLDEVSKLFENLIIMDKGKLVLCEEVDILKEKAFYVSGEKEKLKEVCKDLNLINSEEVGGYLNLAVFEKISYGKKKELENMGFKVENMPLQKLFVNMVSSKNILK